MEISLEQLQGTDVGRQLQVIAESVSTGVWLTMSTITVSGSPATCSARRASLGRPVVRTNPVDVELPRPGLAEWPSAIQPLSLDLNEARRPGNGRSPQRVARALTRRWSAECRCRPG